MTDHSHQPGRIDLGELDASAERSQEDRVVHAAMLRITGSLDESRSDVLASVSAFSRPMLAAAAVLLTLATGTVLATSRGTPSDQPASVLATWADAQHVPTNGELLAAFQGYRGGGRR